MLIFGVYHAQFKGSVLQSLPLGVCVRARKVRAVRLIVTEDYFFHIS